MQYQKGQAVSVKDCDGRSISLRIWRDAGSLVFVVSDEVFRLLENGHKDVWPLGFAKSDVTIRRTRQTK
jgi:hypothetical protein